MLSSDQILPEQRAFRCANYQLMIALKTPGQDGNPGNLPLMIFGSPASTLNTYTLLTTVCVFIGKIRNDKSVSKTFWKIPILIFLEGNRKND